MTDASTYLVNNRMTFQVSKLGLSPRHPVTVGKPHRDVSLLLKAIDLVNQLESSTGPYMLA